MTAVLQVEIELRYGLGRKLLFETQNQLKLELDVICG